MKWEGFLPIPQYISAKFCLKPVCETHSISSSCRLTCILSKLYQSLTVKCITGALRPKMLKHIYFLRCLDAVLYIALKSHVSLPRFPETFSMWCRIIFGTKWHRFYYCCNLWWVQPLYCINTLDYYWSLKCSWSIACRCCPNYILILGLTPSFYGLGKDNWKNYETRNI